MKHNTTATALLLALALLFGPAAFADLGDAGTCGGITFKDDPELPTRLRVLNAGDIPLMALVVEVITNGAGERVISLEYHATPEAKTGYDCAVLVSQVDPAMDPTEGDRLLAELRREHATDGK